MCSGLEEIHEAVSHTLLSIQRTNKEELRVLIESTLIQLTGMEIMRHKADQTGFELTGLGLAAYKGNPA